MIRLRHVSLSLLLLACGGGDAPGVSNPPPPPPPPPPAPVIGPPATVVVDSGDGQSAEPGATVANPVVILVRDSANRAVPNVAVSFSIDSGGGATTTSSATTGQDGRARSGAWSLGPTEGPQVMRIAAGPIVARARAVSRFAPRTLPALTLPVGGGTVRVDQPGSALNGLTIVVPAGSFSAPRTVSLSYGSPSSLQPPAGGVVLTPLVTVRGLEQPASQPLELTLPARVPRGFTPVLLLRDSVSGATTPARVLRWDSTSVTAALYRVDGSNVPIRAPAPRLAASLADVRGRQATSSRGNLAAPTPGQAYVVTIPDAQIFRNRASTFRLSDDAWNFAAIPTVLDGYTQYGMVQTSLYWHLAVKPSLGKTLKAARYLGGLGADVPWGNYNALRLVSLVSSIDEKKRIGELIPQVLLSDYVFRSIAAAMVMTADQPQPLILFASDGEIRPVLVTAISGQTMLAYDPTLGPAAPTVVQFDANYVLTGYSASPDNPAARWNGAITQAIYDLYDPQEMASEVSQAASPTYGNDRWPATILRSQFDTVGRVADTLFYIDTLTVWNECSSCRSKGAHGITLNFPLLPAPPNGEVLPSWLWTAAQGSAPQFTSASGPNVQANLRGGFRYNAGRRRASAVFINTAFCDPETPTGPQFLCWVDARTIDYVLRPTLTLAPHTQVARAGTDLNFSIQYADMPHRVVMEWEFGDNTPRVQTGSATTASHKYQSTGLYKIRVRAFHPTTNQMVGIDSTNVNVVCDNQPVVDARDGRSYRVVCLSNGQTWMGENLQFNAPGSGCYDRVASNCTTFGRLYPWSAAMAGAASSSADPSGVRGACMAGWHVPSPAEWQKLITLFGGATAASPALRAFNSFGGAPPTNSSGMTLLGGGLWRTNFTAGLEDEFSGLGTITGLWTSFEGAPLGGTRAAQFLSIGHVPDGALVLSGDLTDGRSLRCVRN